MANQIYFDSQSTNDGQRALTSTFEVGSNLDIAQVQVQNKIQIAQPNESWVIPLAVIFGIPAGVLGAILFVWGRDIANDVYTNIGLIMLIGLIAKNAILIVEFARQQRSEGKSIFDASVEAAQLRLRPILMTSLAFILGVVPLALSSGAGAASRVSLGTAVIGGMLVGTIIGIFVVPAFFYVLQRLVEWRSPIPGMPGVGGPASVHAADGSALPAPERTETPTGERR